MSSSTTSTPRTRNGNKPRASRYRGFLITLNYIDDVNLGEPELTDAEIEYMIRGSFMVGHLPRMTSWVAQFERGGADGRLHLQAYAGFSGNALTEGTVGLRLAQLLKSPTSMLQRWRANVDGVKNSGLDQRRSFDYCKKDDTHALDYPMRFEFGTTLIGQEKKEAAKEQQAKKKRKKADDDAELLNKIRTYIDESDLPTWIGFTSCPEMDLIAHSTSWVKKCFNTNMERKRLESRVNRRYIDEVIVLWGSSGSGKTTKAEQIVREGGGVFEKKCWNQGDDKYFGQSNQAYTNEENILFEEMVKNHSLDFGLFKRLCDVGHKKGIQLPVKNSFAVSNHKRVIFTTNDNPLEWFEEITKSEENFDAFRRRITCLMYYPKKCPDGSYNQYKHHQDDSSWEPYCEDISMNLDVMTYDQILRKDYLSLLPDFLRAGVTRLNCEFGDYRTIVGTWKWSRAAYQEQRETKRIADVKRREEEEKVNDDVAFAIGEVPLNGIDLLVMADAVTDPVGVEDLTTATNEEETDLTEE